MNTSIFLLIQDDEGVFIHSAHETLDKALSVLKQVKELVYIDDEIGDGNPYYFSINPPLKLRATTHFSEWFIVECPIL